jgi:hypothetical protein
MEVFMHAHRFEKTGHTQKDVLKKALGRAAIKLEISRQELSAIVGPSESSLSRIFSSSGNKQNYLEPESKEGQLAILLLRLYRNLDVLFGGNEKQCCLWLRSENFHLGAKPIELIKSIEGLIQTIQYLDAMRGKN